MNFARSKKFLSLAAVAFIPALLLAAGCRKAPGAGTTPSQSSISDLLPLPSEPSQSVSSDPGEADSGLIRSYTFFPPAENETQILGAVVDYGFEGYQPNGDFSFTAEQYTADESAPEFLIVPKYQQSRITVQKVRLKSDGTFAIEETLFESDPSNKEPTLLLQAILPESAPQLQVVVSHDGDLAVWRLSYNGKDESLLLPKELKGFRAADLETQ